MNAGLALAWGLMISAVFNPAGAATIAIDVGHFREEPGATSARGRPEFAFNLDLARELAKELEARGYATQMIGADGGMRDLWRRPRAARGADLFISVHHDSTQARYQSTWIHDGTEQRYSDRFAGFSSFVSRENPGWRAGLRCASAIGGVLVKAGFMPSLYHADPVLGENRPFADKTNGVHYYDHLAVLRHAAMPALLFEAGVIVNREEEARMGDEKIRRQIAAGVADGIVACLQNNSAKNNDK
jgi:N-acetylmuramoyl-L-alanine amidase